MHPGGGGPATGLVGERLRERFGSHERFVREFTDAAGAHFGSGWLWLVWRAGTLEILTTSNAGTPLVRGDVPLLALDLWEHAYYLDHQNRRSAYVNAFLEELVNWETASRTLAELGAGSELRTATRARAGAEATLIRGGLRTSRCAALTGCWQPVHGAGGRAAPPAPRPHRAAAARRARSPRSGSPRARATAPRAARR